MRRQAPVGRSVSSHTNSGAGVTTGVPRMLYGLAYPQNCPIASSSKTSTMTSRNYGTAVPEITRGAKAVV